MLVEEEAYMENQPKQASWAEIIRKEREQRAWTQEEVAEKLGIEARTIRNWESGTSFPVPKYRRELARLYEKSLRELKLVEPLISLHRQDNGGGNSSQCSLAFLRKSSKGSVWRKLHLK